MNKNIKTETITELCSYCEKEVELENKFKSQICPNCKKKILPCSMCNMEIASCNDCPLENLD